MKKFLSLCTFILLAFFAKAQTLTIYDPLAPLPSTLNQSSTNQILAIYQVTASGGNLNITSLTVTANGTFVIGDISNYKLWQNGTDDLTGATQLGGNVAPVVTNNPFTFSGFTASIQDGLSSYFLITCDISATAINGHNIYIKAFNTTTDVTTTASVTQPTVVNGGYTHTIYGPQVTITSGAGIHPPAGSIATGTIQNTIAAFQLDVNGYSSVTLSQLVLTTSGTYAAPGDITQFQLWINTTNTLTGATQIGGNLTVTTGGTLTFTGGNLPYILSASTTYYVILTADVAGGATLGRTVLITTTSFANWTFTAGTYVTGPGNPIPGSYTQTIVGNGVTINFVNPPTQNVVATTDVLLYEISLTVTGAVVTFTGLTVTTAGTYAAGDLVGATPFHLYYTTTNVFSTANSLGSVAGGGPGSNLAFTPLSLVIPNGTTIPGPLPLTIYLWVTGDFQSTAVGKNINITSTAFTNITFAAGPTKYGTDPVSVGGVQSFTLSGEYWTGTGTWNSSNTNWSLAPGGPYTSPWIAGNIANFEGIAGTATVNNGGTKISAKQINSSKQGYIVNANSGTEGITLSSPANISVSFGDTYFGNNGTALIYGSNGLNKQGAGGLQLRSALGSAFSGGINVAAGELVFGSKNSSLNPSGFLTAANDLTVDNAQFTIAANTSANASLKFLNSATISGTSILSLYKTASGGFAGSGGGVLSQPTTNGAAFSSSNAVPLTLSGQLTFNDGGSSISGPTSGNNGGVAYRMSFGATTLLDSTTIITYTKQGVRDASLQIFGNDFNIGTRGVLCDLAFGGSGPLTFNTITSAGKLTDNGKSLTFLGGGVATASSGNDGGALILNSSDATNTLTGKWRIGNPDSSNFGYVVVNHQNSLTSGNITVNGRSQLRLQPRISGSLSFPTSPQITLYGNGNSSTISQTIFIFTFTVNGGYKGSLWLQNLVTSGYNIVTLNSPIVLGSSDAMINVQDNNSATSSAAHKWILGGAITGTGGLTKYGIGTLQLSNAGNTWTGGTNVRWDTVIVASTSLLGPGALTMREDSVLTAAPRTYLQLQNAAQTVSALSTYWAHTTGTFAQTVNLNSTTLTVDQASSTTFGNGNSGASTTLTGQITGTGNLIKDGAGTLVLTGLNTFTGLVQVKNGTLQLNHTATAGSTLSATDSAHIVGGTLRISKNQTFSYLTLAGGTLQLDAGITVTITSKFTYGNGSISFGAGSSIVYSGGSLVYAGSSLQTTGTFAATQTELQNTAGSRPSSITFNNFSYSAGSLPAGNLPAGVILGSNISPAGSWAGPITVNGWLDLSTGSGSSRQILGTGATFTLNGLTNVVGVTGSTTSGSNIVTVNSTSGMWIGMRVSGSGIPDRSYITYINPLVANTIWLSSNATATASGVALTVETRGGLKVIARTGATGHIGVTGTRTYNSGASYYFFGPSPATGIMDAPFPVTGGSITFNNPVWDVYTNTTTGGFESITQNISSVTVSDTIFMLSGRYNINGNTLTLNGYSYGGNGVASGSGSNLTGSATSNVVVGGTTSDNLGTLYFTPGSQLLNNFTMQRTTTDVTATLASRATLGTDLTVGGVGAGLFTFTNGDFDLNGNTLTLNGNLAGSSGAFIGSSTSGLYVSGSAGGDLGNSTATIRFKPTFETLNLFTMNRSGGVLASNTVGRAVLGTSLTTNGITLTNGVLATGSNTNLLTWNRSGALTQPQPSWAASSTLYQNSYIATCNAAGATIAPADPTPGSPGSYDGSYGFRILNAGSNTAFYFPVGHTYLRTPNRMMIQNSGTASDFTVVVGTGDLLGTPLPRVNRIWWVNSSASSGVTANMRLFFTEKDPSIYAYPGAQDETEIGFDFTNIRLVQKNYANAFLNLSETPGDQTSFPYGANAGFEVYGLYTIGISHDWQNNTNGINVFTRFSVVNDAGGIILPVNIINLNAYQKGEAVKVDWTSLNELNVDRYEVQRSANATAFITLGSVKALDNGQPRIDYSFTDLLPVNGDNFYRIKAVDKNGETRYTNIVKVNIGGIRTGFAIYPNPVTGRQFTVQMSNLAQGKYLLQLYNVLGQQIMNRTIEYNGGSAVQNIAVPMNARPGVYMLRITNGQKSFTQSLIVE